MTLKNLFMASSSVLVLSAVGALADNNEAWLQQHGASNSALIDQTDGAGSKAGADGLEVTQTGTSGTTGYNALMITQSGDDNEVGLTGAGVIQSSNRANALRSNNLSITQSSSNNSVGEAERVTTGPDRFDRSNTMVIVQQTGDNNSVGTAYQYRQGSASNSMAITMSGSDSNITLARQQNPNDIGGGTNTLTIDMTGTGNGNGTFSGPAALSGASAAEFVQGLTPNGTATGGSYDAFADIDISGSGNNVGTLQTGRSNTVGTIDVGGVDNQLGVSQQGNNNAVAVAAITGSDNNIGVDQNDNEASVTVIGSMNGLLLTQNGGGALAADNFADIDITGDGNGTFASFASLTNAANVGLTSGYLTQSGFNNDLFVDVQSSDNAFATLQDGDSNKIDASVSVGNGNQFAISQIGNSNVANMVQAGAGNNAGIMQ